MLWFLGFVVLLSLFSVESGRSLVNDGALHHYDVLVFIFHYLRYVSQESSNKSCSSGGSLKGRKLISF